MDTIRIPRGGDRISRYLLLQGLARLDAEGLRPATFLALDTESLEECVLQVPRPTAAWEPRTDRQLATASQIASPFLGQLLAGSPGNDDGARPRFVSRWTPGCLLSTLLADGGVDTEAAVKILWGLGMGLSTLHANGLVHGDLHPGNVILTPEGDVVLVGFAPEPFSQPTGTVDDQAAAWRYSAPEWNEHGEVGVAGDVYALGLIAYELFTGKPLLPRSGRARALENQVFLQKALARAAKLTRKVPEGLDQVLHGMLQLEPGDRPRCELDFTGALLTVLPAGVGDEPLPRILWGRFRRLLDATRRARLEEARRAVCKGDPLGAAGALVRLASVAAGTTDLHREEALETGRDVLWLTLTQARRIEPAALATACLELLRAGERLELCTLAQLARARLEDLVPPGDPMATLLTGPAARHRLEPERETFRFRLEASPEDEDALLSLALLTPEIEYRPEFSLAEARAALLAHQRLYSAAVFHRARDLALLPGDARTLADLAELARRASRRAQGMSPSGAPETSPPPLPRSRRQTDSVLDDLMADLNGLADEDPTADRPAPGTGASPPDLDPELLSRPALPSLAEAESLLERGRSLVDEGRVSEAAWIFGKLLARGPAERERFHAPVSREVRRLAWITLLPGWDSREERVDQALAQLLELTRELELEELVPLIERLLLASLPGAERAARVEQLIARQPTSIPFLQAAARQARQQGDSLRAATFLTSLGWALLERGEITPASRHFMESKAMGGESRSTVEGLGRVFEFAEQMANAAQAFRRAETRLLEIGDPQRADAVCEEFLEEHPGYLPALERRQLLALESGDRPLAARLSMELAERALLRGDTLRARSALREALRMKPELDQALLYLAALEPAGPDAPSDLVHFRIQLLCREGLYEAGIHLARQQLAGTSDDLPVHELLVLLCRQAGRDATPHLLALGRLALDDRDAEFARRYFREALDDSPDRAATAVRLRSTPGIDRVFSSDELQSLDARTPGET